MPGATAAVMAHEMGHSIGFEHDNKITGVNCTCDDPVGRCVMYSRVRSVALDNSLFLALTLIIVVLQLCHAILTII